MMKEIHDIENAYWVDYRTLDTLMTDPRLIVTHTGARMNGREILIYERTT